MEERLTRRTFVKGAAVTALGIAIAPVLSACSAQGSESESTNAEPESEPASNIAESGVLVAYFSATGNTKNVAEIIASHAQVDTFEITPAEPYTEEDLGYNNDDSRVSIEHEEGITSVELVSTTPENFDQYTTVFVGYPIWWGDASWVVNDFITRNSFESKTVIPFCTSASSPLGSSGENLASLAGTGTWIDGQRFSSSAEEEEVTAWVDSLELA